MAIKLEKNRKYYRKCPNNFATNCVFINADKVFRRMLRNRLQKFIGNYIMMRRFPDEKFLILFSKQKHLKRYQISVKFGWNYSFPQSSCLIGADLKRRQGENVSNHPRLRSIIFTSKVTVMSSVIPGKLEFTVPVLGLGTPWSFSSVYLHSV